MKSLARSHHTITLLEPNLPLDREWYIAESSINAAACTLLSGAVSELWIVLYLFRYLSIDLSCYHRTHGGSRGRAPRVR